jgi:hypothetical protein
MEFSIDGSPSSSYTAPLILSNSSLFHQALWTSEVLPEGPHTLLITQSSAESQNGTVSLDYLLYNTTSTSGKTIFIDDADDDPRVEYSSASRWNTQFTTGSTNRFFKHTTHSRESIGSAVTFKFEGAYQLVPPFQFLTNHKR